MRHDAATRRALAKVQHHNGREWTGYLTPADVLKLHEAGARMSPDALRWARNRTSEGVSRPTWVYFELPDELRPKQS